jgi:Tfp pilus assembly protein PilF
MGVSNFHKGMIRLVLTYLKHGETKEAMRLLECILEEDK